MKDLIARGAITASVALVAIACCSAAQAQTETPQTELAPDEDSDRISEIVVTAQKNARAESLQKVPLAITAVDMVKLQQANITDIADIGRLAPNVQLQPASAYPGFANFTIRGIGVNGTLQSLDPAVSISFDGMPYSFQLGTLVDSFDVESIEILRGPQGVLFGRNATGGAVAFRTRRPKSSFAANASVRVGNFGRLDETVSVEGPISGNFRAKIAVAHRKTDGAFNDRNGGTTLPAPFNPTGADNSSETDQSADDTWLLRAIAVYNATSNLEFSLIGEYIDSNAGGTTARVRASNLKLTSTSTGFGYTPPPFGDEINLDSDQFNKFKSYRTVLETNLELPDVGLVTSVTGYREASTAAVVDNDGTPFVLNLLSGSEKDKQFSQELRFASTFSDVFRFVVGGYYSNTRQYVDTRRASTNTVSGVMSYVKGLSTQRSKVAALFGNVDLTAIDGLTLSAGARLTKEDKSLSASLRATPCTGGPAYTGCQENVVYDLDKSWNDISPRFAANYEITDDLMVYASWTKGFRSGAFNIRANVAAGLGPSEPETASSFEGGFKANFWDGRAKLNVAAFHTDYNDIIRVLTVGVVQDILNAAKATIEGVEVEGEVRPGAGFALTIAGGYTNAKFSAFDLNQDGTTSAAEKALKFDRVPKWTLTLDASKQFDVADMGHVTVRGGYSYRSSTFTDVQNSPSLKMNGYGIWDASVIFKPSDTIEVALYGRNLTNKNYWDYGTRYIAPALDIGDVVFGGTPRTYGIELRMQFR